MALVYIWDRCIFYQDVFVNAYSAKIQPLFESDCEEALESNSEMESDEAACEIRIRCLKPSADGQMKVSLEYTGDSQLACYLIEHAQSIIEEEAQAEFE